MKVWPKSDTMRKILRHPLGNIGFHEQGPADWPNDSYTHRRIADGDVTTEEPHSPVQEPETMENPTASSSDAQPQQKEDDNAG